MTSVSRIFLDALTEGIANDMSASRQQSFSDDNGVYQDLRCLGLVPTGLHRAKPAVAAHPALVSAYIMFKLNGTPAT
jgi:hypothetical protein